MCNETTRKMEEMFSSLLFLYTQNYTFEELVINDKQTNQAKSHEINSSKVKLSVITT